MFYNQNLKEGIVIIPNFPRKRFTSVANYDFLSFQGVANSNFERYQSLNKIILIFSLGIGQPCDN